MQARSPSKRDPFWGWPLLFSAVAGGGCGSGSDAPPPAPGLAMAGAAGSAAAAPGGAGGGTPQGGAGESSSNAGESSSSAGESPAGLGGATANAGTGGTADGGGGLGAAGWNAGGTSSGGTSAAGAGGSQSPGCGVSTLAPSAEAQQTLQVDGTTRYYLLYVPPGYAPSKPLPLVFVFHGRGGSDVWAAAPPDAKDWYGRFALKEASAKHAILVYPMGSTEHPGSPGNTTQLPSSLGQSTWNEDPDMAFFDALWADLAGKWCIDTPHVFAAGYSMGAAFSNTLGCERASVIRAVAPIEGWGPGSAPTSGDPACSSEKGQESAFVIHGTKDATIPYSMGQASAAFWRADAGCSASSSPASSYSTSKLSCVAYQGCAAGHDTFFCTHGGDHQIPADAGAQIWKFFSAIK